MSGAQYILPLQTSVKDLIKGEFSDRHPSTKSILRFFDYGHLPKELQGHSMTCAVLAVCMVHSTPDGPELTAGLRKLLEAKDCFVRANLPEE